MERAKQSGQPLAIEFVIPPEGGPMSIDAFAIPKDAPHPEEAYALLDFLLRPDIAARDARATGLTSGDEGGDREELARLFPEGAVYPALQMLIDQEWTRLKAGEEESAKGKKVNPHIRTVEPRSGAKAKKLSHAPHS